MLEIFEKTKLDVIEENQTYGKYEIGPLPRGYGNTIGVPLRRALLSSIPGAAITSVKVKGVQHEFTALSGVKDDILRVLLKLKKVVVINYSEKPQTLALNIEGQKTKEVEVTAGDIENTESTEVFNKDYVITTVTDGDTELNMELNVENGVGYQMADNDKRAKAGVIPLDANFSPVERVNIDTIQTRLGQETDLDKLQIEIWTKGNVSPKAAMQKALEICSKSFGSVLKVVRGEKVEVSEEVSEDAEEAGKEEEKEKDKLVCPKCGKEYKSKAYFDKHIKSCEG